MKVSLGARLFINTQQIELVSTFNCRIWALLAVDHGELGHFPFLLIGAHIDRCHEGIVLIVIHVDLAGAHDNYQEVKAGFWATAISELNGLYSGAISSELLGQADHLALCSVVYRPEDYGVVERGSRHIIILSDVQTDNIPAVPAIDLLLSNDLATFILQWSLQKGDLSIPQSGCGPVVGLFVEEGYV